MYSAINHYVRYFPTCSTFSDMFDISRNIRHFPTCLTFSDLFDILRNVRHIFYRSTSSSRPAFQKYIEESRIHLKDLFKELHSTVRQRTSASVCEDYRITTFDTHALTRLYSHHSFVQIYTCLRCCGLLFRSARFRCFSELVAREQVS